MLSDKRSGDSTLTNLDPAQLASHHRWLEKTSKSKPLPVRTLMTRTFATSLVVLDEIAGMEFSKLSYSLYFYCRDVHMQQFTRLYESQLELAAIDPEKFVKGLHKFFNETALKIKKENLYQGFFEFNSLCARIRYQSYNKDKEAIKVVNAYQNLLMQQTDYLRPDKFNFDRVVCGLTTDGEVMTAPENYADIDSITEEFKELLSRSKSISSKEEAEALFVSICNKKGHTHIHSWDDMNAAMEDDKVYGHHINALAPYINEYNFDILPTLDELFSRLALPFYGIQCEGVTDAELVEMLKKRARTLPANGIVFKFEYDSIDRGELFEEVLMKEVFRDDRIIMLYKFKTAVGALAGYYDTKDGFMFTVLLETGEDMLVEKQRLLILYLYACATVRDGAKMLASFNEHFYFAPEEGSALRIDLNITPYGSGGKLRRVYGVDEREKRGPTGPRAGNEKYMAEMRDIAGFIRKVGRGRSPSTEAVERARALGFDLEPDETYVQPFTKNVLKLVAKEGEAKS